MNDLPTHIQRSRYAPDWSQRQRDKRLPPEDIQQFEKSERMILRGPGRIGSPTCNVMAVFKYCPDDLMEAIIHRYNEHSWLMAERERLKAHRWRRVKLTLVKMFRGKPSHTIHGSKAESQVYRESTLQKPIKSRSEGFDRVKSEIDDWLPHPMRMSRR